MSKTAIVPVEATRDMQWAMVWQHEEVAGYRLPDGEGFDFDIVGAMHNAMVNARPPVPDELIEEAAKAIYYAEFTDFDDGAWEQTADIHRHSYRRMARAAARVFNGGNDE